MTWNEWLFADIAKQAERVAKVWPTLPGYVADPLAKKQFYDPKANYGWKSPRVNHTKAEKAIWSKSA